MIRKKELKDDLKETLKLFSEREHIKWMTYGDDHEHAAEKLINHHAAESESNPQPPVCEGNLSLAPPRSRADMIENDIIEIDEENPSHAGVHSVGTKPFGKHKRPVNQISETGQTLKCFDSLTSAAASVGMRPCNLYRVIKNNLIIKSCRWQYADMVGPMSKKKEESFRRQGVPGGVGRVEGRALIDKKRDRNGKSMRPFPDSAEVKDKSLHSLDCFDRFQVWLGESTRVFQLHTDHHFFVGHGSCE